MDEDAQQEAAARANPVTIELDFRQVHSNDDVWDEIDRKLGFDDFGRNLDAFVTARRIRALHRQRVRQVGRAWQADGGGALHEVGPDPGDPR
jgi:hypothetical protein